MAREPVRPRASASARLEADARVTAIAKRLGLAAAAPAQIRTGDTRDHAARSAGDLEIATHAQRPIHLRIDCKRAVARRERVGAPGVWFAARAKADFLVRAIAKRFVLRRAAAAQSGAESDCVAIDAQVAAKRVWARFAHSGEIDRRRDLLACAVLAHITYCPGRASVRNLDQALDADRVGIQPGAFYVGEEHRRRTRDTEARVNAAFGLVHQREF